MHTFAPLPVPFKPVSPKRRRHTTKPRPRPRPKPRPADRWPDWTDRVRYTIAEVADLAEVPTYTPSPAAEAWNAAYALGYEHTPADPSSDLTPEVAISWRHGYSAGWLSRCDDDATIDRRQAESTVSDLDMYPYGGVS